MCQCSEYLQKRNKSCANYSDNKATQKLNRNQIAHLISGRTFVFREEHESGRSDEMVKDEEYEKHDIIEARVCGCAE